MADSKENKARILKGSKHMICVEEAVDNVIVVRLDIRGTVYRGVLLNSTSENIPYGVNLSRIRGDVASKSDPSDKKSSVENSSVVTRHTYVADSPGEAPQTSQPATQIFNKSWKDKTIRNIRLRPRQVLCSKCKASCNEGGEARKAPPNPPSKQPIPPPPQIMPHPRVVLRKRRSEFVTIDDPEYMGSKKIKLSSTPIIKKTSPVIKISFANPQGKGTVVEIAPKVQTECGSDSDTDDYEYLRLMDCKGDATDGHDMGVYGQKKVKKSLKKARENKTAQSPLYEPAPETTKRTKHNKHKVKHRHRHRHGGTKQGRHKRKEIKSEKYEFPTPLSPASIAMPSPREGGNTPSGNIHGGYQGVPSLWPGQQMGMESPAATPVSPMRPVNPLYSPMISEQQSDDSENTLVPTSNDGLVTLLKPCRGASMESPVSRGTAENVLSSNNRVGNTDNSDSASNSDSSEYTSQAPPNMDTVEQIRPLMMRIQTKYVKKVVLDDGRGIGVGDIVWGKIHGFPWWPGRVNTISISQKDNGVIISQQAHVSWFGSSTMSNMLCSDLYPFLEEFKLRFKKKKRGPYKIAIKQATMAAQALLGEDHPVYDLEGLDTL